MQPLAGNDLVTSALFFAVQGLIHCPLGKTFGTLIFFMLNNQNTAKVCRAEAWILVCSDL